MKVWISDFLVNVMSNIGSSSIVPIAYGRSACCSGVSGAGSGSIRAVTMTELVLSSPFQKSGTLIVCFSTDSFAGGAFFGALSGVGSLATTNTSYAPGGTVNDRERRSGLWPAVTGAKLMSSYAKSFFLLLSFLSSFFWPGAVAT